MRRILAALGVLALALLAPTAALPQASTVIQSGPWTPGHAPEYVGQGSAQPVVIDSGPAGGGAANQGLTELLLQANGPGPAPYVGLGSGPLGTNFCDNDGPITSPAGYHYLCWSANAQGGGLLVYGAAGGAPNLPLQCVINGVATPCFGAVVSAVRVIVSGDSDTAAAGDATIAWDSAATAAKSQAIPACASANQGKVYVFKDEEGNAQVYPITIAPASGTIDGLSSFVLRTNLGAVTIQCDGVANWMVE
jgi:hypothetical protein